MKKLLIPCLIIISMLFSSCFSENEEKKDVLTTDGLVFTIMRNDPYPEANGYYFLCVYADGSASSTVYSLDTAGGDFLRSCITVMKPHGHRVHQWS